MFGDADFGGTLEEPESGGLRNHSVTQGVVSWQSKHPLPRNLARPRNSNGYRRDRDGRGERKSQSFRIPPVFKAVYCTAVKEGLEKLDWHVYVAAMDKEIGTGFVSFFFV